MQEFKTPSSKGFESLPKSNNALHPPEERIGIVLLVLYIDGLIVILGVDNGGEVKFLGIGVGESCVSVRAPLHRSTHAIAVAEIEVVPHADFITIVDYWCTRQGEEQAVQQFNLLAVVIQKWCQASADTEVESSSRVSSIHPIHVVPLFIGHHLKG